MAVRNLSTAALHAEIARREQEADKVRKERDKLAAQLENLDARLADLDGDGRRGPRRKKTTARRGPKPGKRRGKKKSGRRKATGRKKTTARAGGRRRAKNDMSLPEAIDQVVKPGAVVAPKEVTELVKAQGYKSSSKNFGMMVANALAKDGRFKRKGRGQYERVK